MSKPFFGGIRIENAQEIGFYDSDSSNFSAFKAPASLTGNVTFVLPDGDSTGTQALTSNGSATLSWASFLDTSLTDGNIYIGNGSNVATAVLPSGDVTITNAGVMAIASGVIVDGDVNASAAITLSKLAATTASRALASDASGFIVASSVTDTELGYVSGVTSSIQTQLNNLTSTINNFEWQPSALDYIVDNTAAPPTEVSGDRYILSHDGGAPNAAWDGASAGNIVEFDGTNWVATAPSTGTYIGVDDDASGIYLWGGSSWSLKSFEATTASDGLTKVGFDVRLADGGVTNVKVNATAAIDHSKMAALTASRAMVTDGSGFSSASAVTGTELGYLSGVTSAIQTQLNGKASLALDNLASVAINTSLISDTDNTDDLGSSAIGWANAYANALHMDSNSQTTAIQGSASATASVTYSLPPADGTSGFVLSTNGSGVLSWVSNASVNSFVDTWVTADTATKAITHSLGSTDVLVQVYDVATGDSIEIDSVTRTNANTVTVTASQAPPAGNWKVLIMVV